PFGVGYDFNHEAQVTKDLVDRVVTHWLTNFKVDGFRWDLSKGFTQNSTTDVGAWGNYDASRIVIWKRIYDKMQAVSANSYCILEHFAANNEETELSNYGMLLWGNGNGNFREASKGNTANSDFGYSITASARSWTNPHLVGYAESHDEERLMYDNLINGNSNGSYNIKDTNISLKRLEMAACFLTMVPGPKMIWQMGELGYHYSINTCTDLTINNNCRLAEKPIKWDYLNNSNRKNLYNIYAKLFAFRTNPAFTSMFNTAVVSADLTGTIKRITVGSTSVTTPRIVVVGNFGTTATFSNVSFVNTGTWYNLFNNATINVTGATYGMNLQPGEYYVYTNTNVNNVLAINTTNNNIITNNIINKIKLTVAPNPIGNSSSIVYELPNYGKVDIKLIDINGQIVNNIYSGFKTKVTMMLSVFAFCMQAIAQDKVVTGKVTDANGAAVSNVTIKVKNGKALGSTSADGSFSVKAATNAVLQFTSVGFGTVEMQVPASGSMSVSLKAVNDNLGEVVVIGYGTAKKKDLTGSVATVSSKDFVKGALTTPEQMIAGKVAGVSIVANDGTPGSGSVIRIRGGASIEANDPLIIIDGVPVGAGGIKGSPSPLSLINPNDIESFTILKDASAAAIYGSRASNGVIIITTKKGKSGKPAFSYSSTTSLYTPSKYLDVMSADQFRTYIKANGSANDIAKLGTTNTDWQKEIYRDALGFDNSIGVRVTHKKIPYRASIGYLNQQGILDGTNLKRTTLSLNLSPKFFTDHLRVDVSLKGAVTSSKFADGGAVSAATEYDPTQPVYSSSPRFGGYREWIDNTDKPFGTQNPVGLLKMYDKRSHVERSIGNIQFDYKFHFLPELRANLNLGYDAQQGSETVLVTDSARSQYMNFTDPNTSKQKGGLRDTDKERKLNTLMEFYLNYVKETKAGRFDLMAGYSYQNFKTTNPYRYTYTYDGTRRQILDNQFEYNIPENTMLAYYGRFNYSYKGKYLFTASVRRDASSKFAEKYRWGTFPSFAAAWRIKDESFLKNVRAIDELKLRVGYGITGQQEGIGLYDYLPRYTVGSNQAMYQFGGVFYNTLSPAAYFDRKWEQTNMTNVAVDFGFAKNRITGTLEYYYRKTKDLFNYTDLPGGANFQSRVFVNAGDMKNEGVELTLNLGIIRKKDMTFDISFNGNYNKNTITRLELSENSTNPGNKIGGIGDVADTRVAINSTGYTRGAFFVYKQIYDKAGKPIEGLVEDINRDGSINTDKDQYRYKQIDPIMFFGCSPSFTYKKFSAGFTMRASYGNYMFNARNARTANMPSVIINTGSGFLANTSTNILATNFKNTNEQSRLSDYYVENASFIRMDNINFGYNFGKVFNKTTNLRVGANVQNVFVITKYSGLDPEVFGGVDNTISVRPRVFVLTICILTLGSCQKKLDLFPTNDLTPDKVFATTDGYTKAIAKVYAAYATTGSGGPDNSDVPEITNAGFSDFYRQLWYLQEFPTDEAVVRWTGDPGLQDFHNLSWTSTNDFVRGSYYRGLYCINIANEFIRQSATDKVASRGITGADAAKIAKYRVEARFLRAYHYWVMMDLFGNPPFVTETSSIGAEKPQQISRANLFAYVESELLAIENDMVAHRANEYGRADKGACQALLARIYLNAKVYTGAERYTDAVKYSKKVIDAGYTLITNYQNLMLADNYLNTTENILTIPYDGNFTQNYGGTTTLINGAIGGSMQPGSMFGMYDNTSWAGFRTTPEIVNLYGDLTFNSDTRAMFWTNGQNKEINDFFAFSDGFAVTKYRNKTSAGVDGKNGRFSDVDMPIFRLAEMYLIYAEANIASGGAAGDATIARGYLEKLRERAYGNSSSNGDVKLTLDYILTERAKELFWEGHRRTDLIRLNKFVEADYLWAWKGGVKNGTSVATYRKLYPIPLTDINANSNLIQNTGLIILLLITIAQGCKKDENLNYFEGGTASVLSSTLANNSVLPLSDATKDDVLFDLSWTNPNYKFTTGISSQNVQYSIEIDSAGKNFNSIMYSNVLTYTATAYPLPPKIAVPASGQLFLVGDASPGGWSNPVPVPSQQFTQTSPTTFELTTPIIGGNSYLLLPINGSWGDKYGGLGANNTNNPEADDFKRGGGDLKAPAVSGNYKIVVDFQAAKIFLSIFTISVLLIACKKEGALPNYAESTAPVLSASKTTIAPTATDSNSVVATLNWTDPMMSTDSAHKMYVIEIDSTGRSFKQAAKIVLYGTLSKSLIGTELNNILLNFGFKFNVAYGVDVRVTSSYANNNDIKVSNTLKLTATPYKVPPKVELPTTGKLFIVGGATNGGWNNPVSTPTQEFTRIDETTFAGIFDLSSGGSYLLLAVNGGWDEKFGAIGSNNSNNVNGDNFKKGGGDLLAPSITNKYLITVDFQQGKFTCVPYSGPTLPDDLFIVGGATPGGWTNPVPTPSQQFVRLSNAEFEISSLALNQANGMYLFLPVNGSWSEKYGGVGGSNGSNIPLGDSFKQGGSDLAAPTVAGNYKINVNFATGKYTLTKLLFYSLSFQIHCFAL
ncbi:unnamed protein product, partial [Rotaria sp. Silwood1]